MGGRDARRDALQQDKRKFDRKRHRWQFKQHQRRLSTGDDSQGNRRHQEATGQGQCEKRKAARRHLRVEQEHTRDNGKNRAPSSASRRPNA